MFGECLGDLMFRECQRDLDLDGRVFPPLLVRCGEGGRIIGRGYGDLLSISLERGSSISLIFWF